MNDDGNGRILLVFFELTCNMDLYFKLCYALLEMFSFLKCMFYVVVNEHHSYMNDSSLRVES